MVKIYLMGLNVTILDAESAERALEALEKTSVHLIIADVNMPGMDGITFVKRVDD